VESVEELRREIARLRQELARERADRIARDAVLTDWLDEAGAPMPLLHAFQDRGGHVVCLSVDGCVVAAALGEAKGTKSSPAAIWAAVQRVVRGPHTE